MEDFPPLSPASETLARYLSGAGTPADEADVHAWAGGSSEAAAELELLAAAWQRRVDPEPAGNVVAFLDRWNQAADAETVAATLPGQAGRTNPRSPAPARRNLRVSQRRMWAGRGLAAAALGLAIWMVDWSVVREKITPVASRATMQEHVHTTAPGQRARITLADGSSVVLAPNSRLRVPEQFGTHTRELSLTGEAVFTVTHHTAHPFTVRTTNAAVRVLGTTFNVRQYADESAARIAVAEGRVAVDAQTVASAGDLVHVGSNEPPLVMHQGDISRFFSWTDGRITFRATPVPQALEELSRWYGLQIRLDDARLRKDSLTTSLDSASEQEMLDVLATSLNVRVIRKGSQITLVGK